MDSEKFSVNRKIIGALIIGIPIILIFVIILCRHIITPSNDEIVNELKNIKCYSSQVEYTFKNSKAEFNEKTTQYYSADKGSRIEFEDGYERVKVYKGGEIKLEGNQDDEYTIDKDIDVIYPLAFIENILSNPQIGEIEVVKPEWGDGEYLKVNIQYNSKNQHLNKAEFYVDKKNKVPIELKILDNKDKERVIISYKDFKKEKSLDDSLF